MHCCISIYEEALHNSILNLLLEILSFHVEVAIYEAAP